MHPACQFEVKTFLGPSKVLELAEDKAVICIYIPSSIEAPHVHSSGVIYRRVADSSDPVPETDRHLVEKLFQRSKEHNKDFAAWHDQDPELSENESDFPILRVMIEPNLWNSPHKKSLLTTSKIREILNKKENRLSYIYFDTIYSKSGGFVARHTATKSFPSLTMNWLINQRLRSDITIPLRLHSGNIDTIESDLYKYEHADIFIEALKKHRADYVKIVDLNYVFNSLTAIIEAQRELQKNFWMAAYVQHKIQAH